MSGRVAGFFHADAQQYQGQQCQWHMHQEHPAPIRHGQDQCADHRPEAEAHAGNHAPYGKCPRPRCRVAEQVREDGELTNHHRPTANALDISGFRLQDGQRIVLARDWQAGGQKADFLRQVQQVACERFSTVLGPDYNAAHHNHFHLDMGRWQICR